MSSIDKLAKLFNERDNKYHINITTGIIVSADPLKVKWGESIIIEEQDLIVAKLLKDGFVVNYTDDNGTSIITPLQAGDKVIMLPDNDFKNWYLIDKVG